MKSFLLGSTCLLMTLGAAQAADFTLADEIAPPPRSPFVGEIGAYLGLTHLDANDDGDSGTEFLFGGNARLGWWANQWLYLQGDIQGEATTPFDDPSFGGDGRENFDAALHAAYRSPTHALGVFGGWAYTGVVSDDPMTRYYLGGEAQAYLGNFTLYGQAGYSWLGQASDNHDDPVDGPFVRGVVRYFHTPNDKIEAEVSHFWANGTMGHLGDPAPVRELDWGILYEHQFAGMPVALNIRYAGFRYVDFENNSDGNPYIEHMFTIGAKYRFHAQGTLREADMMGTSLDTPMFRGMSWMNEVH
jgi:opacity protein-like surface antigen